MRMARIDACAPCAIILPFRILRSLRNTIVCLCSMRSLPITSSGAGSESGEIENGMRHDQRPELPGTSKPKPKQQSQRNYGKHPGDALVEVIGKPDRGA